MSKDTKDGDVKELPSREKGDKKDENATSYKGSLSVAKVSPRFQYLVELEYAGRIYPFEVVAVDESEAKTKALDANPALREQITKVVSRITRLSDDPVNLDKLNQASVDKLNAVRAQQGLAPLECKAEEPVKQSPIKPVKLQEA